MRDVDPADLQPTERLVEERGSRTSTVPVGLSLVIVRDGATSTYPLPETGRLVIGRGGGADIRIDHTTVSREHVALHLDGERLRVEDLGSSNGTRVRDLPLSPHRSTEVFPDDVVDLGSVLVVVQYRSPSERTRRASHPAFFDVRVEEEAARPEARALLVRLEVDTTLTTHALTRLVAAALDDGDVLTVRSDGALEILFVDEAAEERDARLAAATRRLSERGVVVRTRALPIPRGPRPPSSRPRGPRTMVAHDPASERLVRLFERIADSDLSVLLLGETGVGKEMAAECIHAFSARAERPLLRLNCAAFTESLLDSELFGHARGAFTGAVADKVGLLEAASGGTVLLDEVGDMPLATQVRLLRVLDAKEVLRIGTTKARPIDIRVLAATHCDLEELITVGRFREDLYYRLNGISVIVPPLRERPRDIAPLARHFLARVERPGRRSPTLDATAIAWLEARAWAGNVRELRNVIERVALLSDGPSITAADLVLATKDMRASPSAALAPARVSAAPPSLRDEVRELERARIERALAAAGGNQSRAAIELGLSRGALLRRMDLLGLRAPGGTS